MDLKGQWRWSQHHKDSGTYSGRTEMALIVRDDDLAQPVECWTMVRQEFWMTTSRFCLLEYVTSCELTITKRTELDGGGRAFEFRGGEQTFRVRVDNCNQRPPDRFQPLNGSLVLIPPQARIVEPFVGVRIDLSTPTTLVLNANVSRAFTKTPLRVKLGEFGPFGELPAPTPEQLAAAETPEQIRDRFLSV